MAENSIDIKFAGSIDELVTAIDEVCKQIEAMVARVSQAMDETVAKMRQSAQEMTGAFANVGRGAAGAESGARGDRSAAPKGDKGAGHAADQARRQADEIETIHRETSTRINETALRDKRAELQEEVRAHQISVQEEVAQLKAFEDQRFNAQEKALGDAAANAGGDPVKQAKLYQQQVDLQLRHNATLKGLDRELAQDQERTANQTREAWLHAFNPINNAFDQMLTGVLRGTQTFQQAARRAFQNVALAEIESDLKALAQHQMINLLKLNSDKQTEQGGLLYTMFSQSAKTAATKTGAAQRTAAENGGFLSWLGQLPDLIGQWLGLETAKTGATEAGATGRTAAETTAAGTTTAVSGTAAVTQITANAGVAASGAASSQASIPYVGPILAAAAAAAILALVLGFAGGIHSAAGGMYEVPGEILSVLHPQESVIPAAIAQPMRQFFESGLSAGSGGAGGAGGGSGATGSGQTLVIAPQVSAMDGRSVLAALNDPQTMRGMATQLSAYWRLNPSARPAF